MEIERKFASVSSLTGISRLNSSSTSSTSLTASSDVNPASAKLSPEDTGRVIDRSLTRRWTTATIRSPAEMLLFSIDLCQIPVFAFSVGPMFSGNDFDARGLEAQSIITADVRITVKMTARSGAVRQPKIAILDGILQGNSRPIRVRGV